MGAWTLWAGGDLVGEIRRAEPDQPWFFGTWHPTDFFQPYASLFQEELSMLESMEDDNRWDEWENCYQQVWDALLLKTPDGIEVAEWVLHVSSDEAWFRWLGEPFEAT